MSKFHCQRNSPRNECHGRVTFPEKKLNNTRHVSVVVFFFYIFCLFPPVGRKKNIQTNILIWDRPNAGLALSLNKFLISLRVYLYVCMDVFDPNCLHMYIHMYGMYVCTHTIGWFVPHDSHKIRSHPAYDLNRNMCV